MNKNQQCLITILRDHGDNLTTAEIVRLASQYPDLCRGCSSGSAVISAGMILHEEGKIERKIAKGGFRWSLKI